MAFGQDCQLVLSGHIEDADTKEKLSGATITIAKLGLSFVTDNNGDFKYSGLCAGTYDLLVTHAGCEPVNKTVAITKNLHLDILMPHLRNNLQEVVIAGQKPIPSTGFRQQLDARALEASRGSSLAEALSRINGVNMLQTGSSVSKPVIHGLHSIRVLTINNGVRQEGQQWGTEHAPEIDPYIADKLTVIKGVDELKYGSDAIGGVVLVDPRPVLSLPGYRGEVNTAFFTNNNQYVVSGIFEQQLKKISALNYRIQGTFKKGGNIRTPDYRLNNTGLEEKNFSLTANWKKEHYQVQGYYSQFETQIGLFPYTHVGNISDMLTRIEQEKPDDVFLGEKTYTIDRPYQGVLHRLGKVKSVFEKNEHRITITLASQYNHRDEFDVVRNESAKGPQVSLALTTFSEELVYEHPLRNNFRGTFGAAFSQQENTYSGRYLIPNYRQHTYGAYWIEKWNRNKWNVEAGWRYDYKTIATKRLRYGGQVTDHDFNFSTLAASLNAGYALNDLFKWNGTLTLSSRAPHVNELLIGGIHQAEGGYSFLQGNIHLKTEKSLNIASAFSFHNRLRNFSAEINLYHNIISDFIYQQPKPDEPVLTVTGAAPKREYQQADATLTGMDVSAIYQFIPKFRISSRASVLYARNREMDDWLILMPADRWRNELAFDFNPSKKWSDAYIAAEWVSVFRPRVPGDKNGKQDYKAAPPAYSLVNINASATWQMGKTPVTFGVSIHNLFNKAYRDYMNSFRYYSDEMGRNIILRAKIPFGKIL